MELTKITTSNLLEYKGTFQIYSLENSDIVSPDVNIGKLKLRIKHRTTDKRILEFDIWFSENQKWIIEGKNCRDVHISLTINTHMHTKVISILQNDKNEDKWYAISEFDLIRTVGTTNQIIKCILSVSLDENSMKRNPFASLYSDTSLTDFELRCENGSIPVHKVALAVASPVLKTFLESKNNWLEHSFYKFSETDLSTLQHLKDYIYLDVLPKEGLENLLLLASCYMMDELKHQCILEILSKITPENALKISEFAVVHQITELYLEFLKRVQNGTIKVAEIQINEPETATAATSQTDINATTSSMRRPRYRNYTLINRPATYNVNMKYHR